MGLKESIPWQFKVAIKLILSQLPVKYEFWRNLHMFKHGQMHQSEYAYSVFKRHYDRMEKTNESFSCLEFGPGDSLFSALIAYSYNASSSYFVDVGSYAISEMEPYKEMVKYLSEKQLNVPDVSTCISLDDLLKKCRAHYSTNGLASLQKIPDQSIDLIWSQAVLEHVRLDDFDATIKEMRRVISKGGICSHRVDLRDHLGGSLNNLRFNKIFWESDMVASAGFYTNRIRFSEMITKFKKSNFRVEIAELDRWAKLPVKRNKLSREFGELSEDDLHVRTFDVVLYPE